MHDLTHTELLNKAVHLPSAAVFHHMLMSLYLPTGPFLVQKADCTQ